MNGLVSFHSNVGTVKLVKFPIVWLEGAFSRLEAQLNYGDGLNLQKLGQALLNDKKRKLLNFQI